MAVRSYVLAMNLINDHGVDDCVCMCIYVDVMCMMLCEMRRMSWFSLYESVYVRCRALA